MNAVYMFFYLTLWAQVKHFIADYPLQGKYMLGKFKDKGWILPLTAHAGVHFLFTYLIALLVTGCLSFSILVGLLDFVIHFAMDRIKASPKMLGKYQALSKKEMIYEITPLIKGGECYAMEVQSRLKSNTYFWWSLGLDQMVHHLTDVIIAFLIIRQVF